MLRIESSALRGFSFKTSLRPDSIPIAIAGKESVIRFINNKWTGKNGVGNKRSEAINTQIIPAKLPDNK